MQAGVMVARPWPFETIMMAVLLEHEKRIERILKRLAGELRGEGVLDDTC
jgi:hypothetical protein